jgi:hypothetical protein
MELKLTIEEAQKVLLEWAQTKFGDAFNKVQKEGYSFNESFVFTKEETDNESL